MRSLTFLIFVIITFCCWGLYGPVLHVGQELMGADGQKSALRPFICVGVAYFLIAVLFPLVVLYTKGEKGNWSAGGVFWSFTAGLVGAVGALGIIMAFKFQGKPFYVMPLVFGLAPVVNTFTSMFMAGTYRQATAIFYTGVLIVAIGAGGVLYFKPAAPKHDSETHTSSVESKMTAVSFEQEGESTEGTASESGAKSEQGKSESDSTDTTIAATSTEDAAEKTDSAGENNSENQSGTVSKPKPAANLFAVGICIAVTALCWGAYGPVLHKGQAKMNGSRLRPFLFVGLAYFAIAVVVPFLMMPYYPEAAPAETAWPVNGVAWSLGAGAAGAIGALGIIYAFNVGGKPVFIMPLVFGFAPVVNTATEIISKNLFAQVPPGFFVSLAMVIAGAVIVLTCAPRPAKKPAPAE